MNPVLQVVDLKLVTAPHHGDDPRVLVDDVSFDVTAGGSLALVGESGSGKTLTLRAILGLLPPGVETAGGTVCFGDGTAPPADTDPGALRGDGLAVVLQEPTTSLNPTMRVGDIVSAAPRLRGSVSRRDARTLAIDLLDEVGIVDPARRVDAWPHELSGGMRQRVMIAMALASNPRVLLCDEPTTALDVTIQAQIVRLLNRLRDERGLALVFVTHDLALTAQLCDDVVVLRHGRCVERGPLARVYDDPQHDYTRSLLAAVPDLAAPLPAASHLVGPSVAPHEATTLIEVDDLTVRFDVATPIAELLRRHRSTFTAVDGVTLTVARGRSLGIVGESGSGKSTLARCISGLTKPTSGTIRLDPDVGRVQMVFQDPSSSLDPRQRVGAAIDEVLRHHRLVPRNRVAARRDELLAQVGLDPQLAPVLPRHLSGGQRQRVAIARALAVEPKVLIADEAVASLDVSIKANIVTLLRRLQHDLDLTIVFITHDLALVPTICDDLIVMHDGRIVERGLAGDVLARPAEPYTAALVAAVPRLPPRPRPWEDHGAPTRPPADSEHLRALAEQ